MKILLINNFHYKKGGSETVYFNTAELLKAHGHDVIFFSFSDDSIECKQKEYFDYRGGKLKQFRDFFWNLDAKRKLESLIVKERPDLAHVHLFWGGISPSIFGVLKKYNIPLIHTVHDYRMVCPAYTFKNGKGEICEKCGSGLFVNCLRNRCSKGSFVMSLIMTMEMYYRNNTHHPADNISGFVYVSNFAKEKHIQYDKKLAKVNSIVLYNYTKPILEPIKKKKDYILYYGRLSYEKGIPTLLKAMTQVKEMNLKVVGTGPLEDELKEHYSCCRNIEFLGYKSGKELFELVRDAKFVCVPSEWYENNPMTIVESYSLGTPVIGANIGGIPEIIEEGKTGFIFKSRDVKDLAQLLIKMIKLPQKEYEELCRNAYVFYKDNFSAENHYKKLISFYKEILNSYHHDK